MTERLNNKNKTKWDISPLTRDGTHVPCIRSQILNRWTTRQAPWRCVSDALATLPVRGPRQSWWGWGWKCPIWGEASGRRAGPTPPGREACVPQGRRWAGE